MFQMRSNNSAESPTSTCEKSSRRSRCHGSPLEEWQRITRRATKKRKKETETATKHARYSFTEPSLVRVVRDSFGVTDRERITHAKTRNDESRERVERAKQDREDERVLLNIKLQK